MKKQKLKKLLKTFTKFDDNIKGTFDALDSEMLKVTEKLKESVTAKTLQQVNDEFKNLGNTFKPLNSAFEELKQNLTKRNTDLVDTLNKKIEQLTKLLSSDDQQEQYQDEQITQLNAEIEALKQRKIEIPDFSKQIKDTENKLSKLIDSFQSEDDAEDQAVQQQITDLNTALKKLRIDVMNRGSGNMNRQVFIGGVDPLTKYTDMNWKAGSNVTVTYANNNTTKKVDVTIAASGGGGSVSGTVRSINTISTSQAAGAATGTDYVYVCSAGVALTLPDATANTNLYTVKNTSASSVLVATTSAQTIDTSANLILATRFTSVDLISDGSNWEIT